jgi:hypothetical protein
VLTEKRPAFQRSPLRPQFKLDHDERLERFFTARRRVRRPRWRVRWLGGSPGLTASQSASALKPSREQLTPDAPTPVRRGDGNVVDPKLSVPITLYSTRDGVPGGTGEAEQHSRRVGVLWIAFGRACNRLTKVVDHTICIELVGAEQGGRTAELAPARKARSARPMVLVLSMPDMGQPSDRARQSA